MDLNQYKITQLERERNGVVSQPDTLPLGRPKENKAVFDKLVGFFADKYNLTLDVIQSYTGTNDTDISTLKKGVSNAQSAADAAQTTANSAKSAADAAQTTANSAKSAASAAQTTANSAQSTANVALTKGTEALVAALSVQGVATDAQSKATQALSLSQQAVQTAGVATTVAADAQRTATNAYSVAAGISTTAQDALYIANEAKRIAESVAFVYDPVTGLYTSVSDALQSIYNLVKSAPMTAQNFANNAITVDFIRSKNITATELAVRGKQILLGG